MQQSPASSRWKEHAAEHAATEKFSEPFLLHRGCTECRKYREPGENQECSCRAGSALPLPGTLPRGPAPPPAQTWTKLGTELSTFELAQLAQRLLETLGNKRQHALKHIAHGIPYGGDMPNWH